MRNAVVCIAKDEDKYLKEWFEWYHDILGFDDVYVYENNWRYKDPVPSYVHLIPYDGLELQIKSYNDWLRNYSKEYDWVLVVDVDEFLYIRSIRDLDFILDDYYDIPSLAINWRLFGSSGYKNVTDDNYSCIFRFCTSDINLNKHIKQLINLRAFRINNRLPMFLNPHFTNYVSFNQEGNIVAGPWNDQNLNQHHELEIAHYVTKSYEECKIRRSGIRADTATPRPEGYEQFFEEHDKNDVINNSLPDLYMRLMARRQKNEIV